MKLIGLDVGTNGCKASLFDSDGQLLASASREYCIEIPHPNWVEQDAEQVWQLAQEALQEVVALSSERWVDAIGLSVQGEAIIPVDCDGKALRPAILGMDTRTSEQNAWLIDRFGASYLFQNTGMPVHTINTLPKLLWLRQYESETWKTASHFRLYEDFLIQKMTGRALISRCLASRTQLYDLLAGGWSTEILQALELDSARLSVIHQSGAVAGEMLPNLVQKLGFTNQPLVVLGGHDQACGALGVGLVRPGLSMVSTGTAEVIEVALTSPVLTQPLQIGNISVYAHVVPGMYLAMTLNHSGGLLLRWFRDEFCQPEKESAQKQGQDPYDAIFQKVSPEPSSLLLLPHFAGSGTPTSDIASKGAILGLTFATTKRDIAKAILEGLTFELRENIEVLKQGGVQIDELRGIGGGARSEIWLQLKADITGIPVIVPRVTEAASWGAAMLAGYGAGCIADLSKTSEKTLHLEKRYKPNPGRKLRYEQRYQLYRDLYPSLNGLLKRM
jgi:xylulokinase